MGVTTAHCMIVLMGYSGNDFCKNCWDDVEENALSTNTEVPMKNQFVKSWFLQERNAKSSEYNEVKGSGVSKCICL